MKKISIYFLRSMYFTRINYVHDYSNHLSKTIPNINHKLLKKKINLKSNMVGKGKERKGKCLLYR